MSAIWRVAWRSMRRQRFRAALSFGAVFLAVFLTIVMAGFGEGMGQLIRHDIVDAKIGAISVQPHGYGELRDSLPLDLDLSADANTMARLRQQQGVRSVAPRLLFAAVLGNGRNAVDVIVRGIDPSHEYEVLPATGHMALTNSDVPSQQSDALLGPELAHALGLQASSGATLEATTQQGALNALDVTVVGTLDDATAFESKRMVHVPLAFAQRLLEMPGRATEYGVAVDNLDDVTLVAQRLRAAAPDLEVATWMELEPNVAAVLAFQDAVIAIIGFIFLAMAFFGVTNTTLMSVAERRQEIGTMMAIGLRRKRIVELFLCEAFFTSSIAAGTGFFAAKGFERAIARAGGIAMAAPGSDVARYTLLPHAPASMVGCAVVGAVVCSLAAAAYPAYRAAMSKPVDALR